MTPKLPHLWWPNLGSAWQRLPNLHKNALPPQKSRLTRQKSGICVSPPKKTSTSSTIRLFHSLLWEEIELFWKIFHHLDSHPSFSVFVVQFLFHVISPTSFFSNQRHLKLVHPRHRGIQVHLPSTTHDAQQQTWSFQIPDLTGENSVVLMGKNYICYFWI